MSRLFKKNEQMQLTNKIRLLLLSYNAINFKRFDFISDNKVFISDNKENVFM